MSTLIALGRLISNPKGFTSGWKLALEELSQTRVALAQSEAELAVSRQQIDEARAALINNEAELLTSRQQVAETRMALVNNEATLAATRQQIDELNQRLSASNASALDHYVTSPPNQAAAFNLFEGEWTSVVPGYDTGFAALFDDPRLKWMIDQAGGLQGKSVLELGPLECGHTSTMLQAGAEDILSIEANSRAFLRCLVVQNALGFRSNVQLGDFTAYLETCDRRFDFVLASGVLYHMEHPLRVLENIGRVTDAVGIWTHYYDADILNANEALRHRYDPIPRIEALGSRTFALHKQSYLDALQLKGFCGGSEPISNWLTREGLIGALEELGFKVQVTGDSPNHPNGPALTLFAGR